MQNMLNSPYLFLWLLCFSFLHKIKCKPEKIKFFLADYQVTHMGPHPELSQKDGFKSFKMKVSKKDYIFDLSIYYFREDAVISLISKSANATKSFFDTKNRYFLFQGHLRDVKGSLALGYFSQKNGGFRGFFVTDKVYCIEPFTPVNSFLVYKFTDIIPPGCSKVLGKDLECSKTKYYNPWRAVKPSPTYHHQFSVLMNKSNDLYKKQAELFNKTKKMLEELQKMLGNKLKNLTSHYDQENLEGLNSVFRRNDKDDELNDLMVSSRFDLHGDSEILKYHLTSNISKDSLIASRNISDIKPSGLSKGLAHLRITKNDVDSSSKNSLYEDWVLSAQKYFEQFRNPVNAWKEYLNSQTEKPNDNGDETDLNVLSEKMSKVPKDLQCNLEVVVDPSYYLRLNKDEGAVAMDIYTYVALMNEIFRKIVLNVKSHPSHVTFSVQQITIYADEIYSPFGSKATVTLKKFAETYHPMTDSCLTIGFVNKFIESESGMLCDGYIPAGDGGSCKKGANFVIVSHGNLDTPIPMGLFFASLVRAVTRVFGAKDENPRCHKGSYPSPTEVLTEYLTAKISHSEKYSIFTACNIKEIEEALQNESFSRCLVEIAHPLCGNAILDEGEACDCGPEYLCEMLDPCCNVPQLYPSGNKTKRSTKPCTLNVKSDCSDRAQGCCKNCRPTKEKRPCVSGKRSCDISFCDGKSPNCPGGSGVSDGLVCAHGDLKSPDPLLCKNLNCSQHLCSSFGLEPCTCAPFTGLECRYCCVKGGACKPADKDLKLVSNREFVRRDGSPCVGGVCRNGQCVLKGTNQLVNLSAIDLPPHLSRSAAPEWHSAYHSALVFVMSAFSVLFLRYS